MPNKGPLVPNWAQGLVCPDNTQCSDGECEYLHLNNSNWKETTCFVPPSHGKLVICAGPERSGSTWLFNALRFILEATGERVHSYWIHHITQDKLVERGLGLNSDASHILVKTHDWSEEWEPSTADFIAVTERDICGVMNSYIRVGWRIKDMEYLKQITGSYLQDHKCWKHVAHTVIQYDDLADVGGRELSCLNQLCELLHINGIHVTAISDMIRSLPVPAYGSADPITKLWPRHTSSSDKNLSIRPSLSELECKILREHANQFLDLYSPFQN